MSEEKNYSRIKLWILKAFLNTRGYLRYLRLKKNVSYFGGRNNRHGVYMGKRTFYETFNVTGPGYCYWDSKPIEYKLWELGMWKWKRVGSSKLRRTKRWTK